MLAITAMVLAGTPVIANENAKPSDKLTLYTTFGPFLSSAWSTGMTDDWQQQLRTAKPDALAFIGSDGEIRGAQFEQASRRYRSSYKPPLMNDMQLAQAIASSF